MASAMIQCGKNWPLAKRLEFWSMPEPNSGCQLWLGHVNVWGYGAMRHAGKMRRVHRLAWIVANGEIPEGMHVCHRCDVPTCINPHHLWLGTHDENMADKAVKGRAYIMLGIQQPLAKLTDERVREIRNSTLSLRHFAQKFGVTYTAVRHARIGHTWRHL